VRLAVLLVLAALPAQAAEVLDGPAFEALVTGRTLTYGADGAPVRGVERYYPGRRVTWADADDSCLEGRWYAKDAGDAPQICFVYEDDPRPHCFVYSVQGDALLSTNPDGTLPELSRDAPLDVAQFGCEWLGA